MSLTPQALSSLQHRIASHKDDAVVSLMSDFFLHFVWEKRWFFIALIVGGIMMSLPLPNNLSREGMMVLAMSVMATIMFITEPIPLPGVALLIILGQVFLLGLDSSTVAKTLWNDSVLFILGSLMLAVAVVKQKLDIRVAWLIVRITGT